MLFILKKNKTKQITLEASALDFTFSPARTETLARSRFRGVKTRWQEVVLKNKQIHTSLVIKTVK